MNTKNLDGFNNLMQGVALNTFLLALYTVLAS